MKSGRYLKAAAALAALSLVLAGTAAAECVSKAAEATAESEASAKWYVLETMVQSVSWGLWPGFVATGAVAGYTIKGEKYTCAPATLGVTCKGQATFCTS